jgi:cytochrome b subunit of formate dehydrogenase
MPVGLYYLSLFPCATFTWVLLGEEGVFEAMWSGSVDAVWAKQYHDLWYEEKTREIADKPDMKTS